jgi:ABC-type antimicrobial peptide transport system permease subunit
MPLRCSALRSPLPDFWVGLYVIVAGILLVTAVGSAAIPARRATRVDPVVALRVE